MDKTYTSPSHQRLCIAISSALRIADETDALIVAALLSQALHHADCPGEVAEDHERLAAL